MAQRPIQPRNRNDFKVAIICALSVEAGIVHALFDVDWASRSVYFGKAPGDHNEYTTGVIGQHNVVLAYMPGMGKTSAAAVATGLKLSFCSIEIAFVVGVCGVIPKHIETQKEIVLGDCIVSTAVVQYDFGRQYPTHFVRKAGVEDVLGRASPIVRALLAKLQTPSISLDLSMKLIEHLKTLQAKVSDISYPGTHKDRLFNSTYLHNHHDSEHPCEKCIQEIADIAICTEDCIKIGCDTAQLVARVRLANHDGSTTICLPRLHFGRYGSADTIMKSGTDRDQLAQDDRLIAFEMEAAGVWDLLPTILVKSACDYADSHKGKEWQVYAAATAAAGLKAILGHLTNTDPAHNRDTLPQRIVINVPDYTVSHFVQRHEILDQLDIWLKDDTQQKRMVLRGMGGAGKSQLALECCRRAAENKDFTTVLWINASTVSSVQQSFKIILSELDESSTIPIDVTDNINMVAKILRSRPGRWLAILDNFDSPGLFQKPITDYIPKAEGGKTLFTSRDAGSERLGGLIRVSRMTESESLDLLLKRPIFDEQERKLGLRIAAELGHLPLALDQAEAYIRARCLSLQDFLVHFERRKKVIFQEVPGHWEYQLNVFTTWELSFEQLSGSLQVKQNKERFLTLCALFDLSSISREYFEYYCQGTERQWVSIFKSGGVWDSFLMEDLIAECRKLSLLQGEDEYHREALISLHPLTRDWLKLRKTPEEQQEIAEEFTDLLMSYVGAVDLENLGQTTRQRLLANVFSCTKEDKRFQNMYQHIEDNLSYASRVLAKVFWSCDIYDKADELYTQMLIDSQEKHGIKHPDTLLIMHNLALIHGAQGKHNEAEEMYKQVLAGREDTLGAKHPDTLGTMDGLAINHLRKDRHDDAEVLFKQVLVGREEKLGAKHPDTLRTIHNLAIISDSKGRYDEAEQLYKQVLAGREGTLGVEHPHTLGTIDGLAIIHLRRARYDDAEDLFKQVLVGRKEKLGAKHPDTLRTMHNLALSYYGKGALDKAEELYKQVLADRKEKLEAGHPDTLGTMDGLASVYFKKGRLDEAKELYKQALAGRIEKLGAKHPDTLRTMHNLALGYEKQGRLDEAEELYKQVLAGRKEKLEAKHPETLRTMIGLASIYRKRCMYDEAEELYKQVLAGQKEKLGAHHPDTLWTEQELASLRASKAFKTPRALVRSRVQTLQTRMRKGRTHSM